MNKIIVEKADGLWDIALFENGILIAYETVHFDEERDEVISAYQEGNSGNPIPVEYI